MAEADQEQNKSEQATPFKLAKAREKGTVARGVDLGFLVSLATFLGYAWISGPDLQARLGQVAQHALVMAPQLVASPSAVIELLGSVLASAGRLIAWVMVLIFVAVLIFELIQTGPVFTTQPLKPDFTRLNPAQGLKKIMSPRLLIETAKNIGKIIVYTAIAALCIAYSHKTYTPAITDARGLAGAMQRGLLQLLSYFVLAAMMFALFDQLIMRRDYQKKMRMSRRDVRREARDREGDPRLRQRRKQLHKQFVKLSQSVRNVRGADVLITNPTHFAVALRYDAKTMTAPTIVSQAANQYALRLRRLAFVYGVTIVQNESLARGLFRQGELNKQIPEAYFHQVADIYIGLRANRAEESKRRARV